MCVRGIVLVIYNYVGSYLTNTWVLYESLQSGLENQKWGLKRFDGAPTLTSL